MTYAFFVFGVHPGRAFMKSVAHDLKGLRVEVGRQMFMMRGVWCVVVAVQ